MRAAWWASLFVALAVVAGLAHTRPSTLFGPPPDLHFTIPPGTGSALSAGQPAFALPDRIALVAGQSISVFNADDTVHVVFDAPITPQNTYRRTFSQPGSFKLAQLGCSIFAVLQQHVVVDVRDS